MIYEEWLRKVGHFTWKEEASGKILFLSSTTQETIRTVGPHLFSKAHSERVIGSGPKINKKKSD